MITEKDGGITTDLRVVPRSSVNKLEINGEIIKLKITAPPVDGEANHAVVEFLANLLKIPKKSVRIIRGETSKTKTVRLEGIKKEEFLKKII